MTSLCSKYAGKQAGEGSGGCEKLIKGKTGNWELLKQIEMEEQKRIKLWLRELRQRPGERLVQEEALAALPGLREQHRKQRSALLRFLLHSENSLTKPEATILTPDSTMSSEATKGSDYEPTPSCLTFGAVGTQDDCPGPSTTRVSREHAFQKLVYSGYATDELEDGQ